MYAPFSNYESHFLNNPIILELGETRESALTVSFTNDWIDLCANVFNGGFVLNYSLFEHTSLALEYLQGKFENDDESKGLTAQIEVEF